MYFLTITLVFFAGFKRAFFYVVLRFRSMICQNQGINHVRSEYYYQCVSENTVRKPNLAILASESIV